MPGGGNAVCPAPLPVLSLSMAPLMGRWVRAQGLLGPQVLVEPSLHTVFAGNSRFIPALSAGQAVHMCPQDSLPVALPTVTPEHTVRAKVRSPGFLATAQVGPGAQAPSLRESGELEAGPVLSWAVPWATPSISDEAPLCFYTPPCLSCAPPHPSAGRTHQNSAPATGEFRRPASAHASASRGPAMSPCTPLPAGARAAEVVAGFLWPLWGPPAGPQVKVW